MGSTSLEQSQKKQGGPSSLDGKEPVQRRASTSEARSHPRKVLFAGQQTGRFNALNQSLTKTFTVNNPGSSQRRAAGSDLDNIPLVADSSLASADRKPDAKVDNSKSAMDLNDENQIETS